MYKQLLYAQVCIFTTTAQRIYGILNDFDDGFYRLTLNDGKSIYVNERHIVWACEATEEQSNDDNDE